MAQCVVTSSANHSSSKEWIDNGTSEALKRFVPLDHQRETIAQSRFLHLTTTPSTLALILSEIERPAGMLGYEPGPRLGDEDVYFDETVFRRSDILFVNEEELSILEDTIGAIALKRMMHEDQVIVATKGKDGAELITKSSKRFYPVESVPKERVLDSNGAGDAFKSGFYVGMVKTGRIDKAVDYGNTLGARIVQREGALLEPSDAELL
jgi:sugar/nucleoside kinase (ribokinase family)